MSTTMTSKSGNTIAIIAIAITIFFGIPATIVIIYNGVIEKKNTHINMLKDQLDKAHRTIDTLTEHIAKRTLPSSNAANKNNDISPQSDMRDSNLLQPLSSDNKVVFIQPSLPLQAVDSLFNYTVRISSPKPDMFYYSGTKIGGLYWPKEKLPLQAVLNRHYTGNIIEKGNPPRGVFSLVILQVPERKDIELQAWLREGAQSGHYPGLALDDFEIGSLLLELKTK